MEKRVEFSRKGNKIVGILSGEEKKPVVLLIHGLGSSKESWTCRRLQENLNAKGIATLRIDLYGHGESDGDFKDVTLTESTGDVQEALEFLKNEGYEKIGLYGASFGGVTSTLAAAKEDLFVLALKCPATDMVTRDMERLGEEGIKEWKEKGVIEKSGMKRYYKYHEDAKKYDTYKEAEKIKCPTIIVHGNADGVIPLKQSEKLAGIIKDCQLKIVDGADHQFTDPDHFEEMLKFISDFLIEKASQL